LNVLDDALKEKSDQECKVLGMDFEWPLYDGGRVKGRMSVVQFAANLKGGKYCLVLPFGAHRINQSFLKSLQQFLSQTDYLFVGRMIKNDITKLKQDFPALGFTVDNVLDVGIMALHRGVLKNKRGTTYYSTSSHSNHTKLFIVKARRNKAR
jgi:hypothetical protein